VIGQSFTQLTFLQRKRFTGQTFCILRRPFGFKIFLEVVQSFVAVFHEFGKTLLKRKIGRIAATPIYFLRFGGLGNRFFRVWSSLNRQAYFPFLSTEIIWLLPFDFLEMRFNVFYYSSATSEMWTKPVWPFESSTKAPKLVMPETLPSTILPTSTSIN